MSRRASQTRPSAAPSVTKPVAGSALLSLITQLAVISNSLQATTMRTEISALAGRLMEKAVRM